MMAMVAVTTMTAASRMAPLARRLWFARRAARHGLVAAMMKKGAPPGGIEPITDGKVYSPRCVMSQEPCGAMASRAIAAVV